MEASMAVSIYLAKVFGLYLLIMAVGILMNPKRFQEILDDFVADRGLITVTGIINLILGLLIVVGHNVWNDWAVTVTLMGWLILAKGIVRTFFPMSLSGVINWMRDVNSLRITAGILLVLGAFYTYMGFMG